MFCALLGQDIRCAFTGPLVLWYINQFIGLSASTCNMCAFILQYVLCKHHMMLTTGVVSDHLRTKVTPDFHLTYSKNGGNGVGIKMIKMDNFQYFSIKLYVVDVY